MTEMNTRRQYESEIPEAKLVNDSRPAASHSQPSYFNSAHSDAAPPSYSTAMAQLQSDIHGGGQGQYVAQANKYVRLGFLRKVYGILTIQLFSTAIICAIAMRAEGAKVNGYHTLSMGSTLVSSTSLYWMIFALSIVLLIALFCYKNKYPLNMILLCLWTVSLSLSVATACAMSTCDPLVTDGTVKGTVPLSVANLRTQNKFYDGRIICAIGTKQADDGTQAVILAAFITMALFGSLTAFTFQSKWDFSFLGAGLGVALFMLIIWSLCMSLFGFGSTYLFALAGSVIFSLYIVYDTWRLLNVYTPDDYIMASIDLYLDVINLFLMILTLLRSESARMLFYTGKSQHQVWIFAPAAVMRIVRMQKLTRIVFYVGGMD